MKQKQDLKYIYIYLFIYWNLAILHQKSKLLKIKTVLNILQHKLCISGVITHTLNECMYPLINHSRFFIELKLAPRL